MDRIQITSREQWLSLRQQDVTASDIASLWGKNPFKTHLALFNEKSSTVPLQIDSDVLKRGTILEPAVAEALRLEKPDWNIEKATVYIRDDKHRIGCTPDFFVTSDKGNGICQAKTVAKSIYANDENWSEESCPPYIILQTLQEMMLCEVQLGTVAVLIIDQFNVDLKLYPIPRHPAVEAEIKRKALAFWESVENNTPPAPDYAQDGPLLQGMYEKGGGDPIDLTRHNRIGELCEEKQRWTRRRSNAEHALETIDAEIIDILKHHDSAVHPEWVITRKTQKKKEFTVPASSMRVLRVRKK